MMKTFMNMTNNFSCVYCGGHLYKEFSTNPIFVSYMAKQVVSPSFYAPAQQPKHVENARTPISDLHKP